MSESKAPVSTPAPIPVDLEVPPEAKLCVDELIGTYTVKDSMRGGMSPLWTLCNGSDCNYILKYTKVTPGYGSEIDMILIASGSGVAPPIYRTTKCPSGESKTVNEYMIMKKLTGPTLKYKYPYTASDVQHSLDLYYKLLIETHVDQNDFHADNLMYDHHRLYLIDYGLAYIVKTLSEDKIFELVTYNAFMLISSFMETENFKKLGDEATKKYLKALAMVWIIAKFPNWETLAGSDNEIIKWLQT